MESDPSPALHEDENHRQHDDCQPHVVVLAVAHAVKAALDSTPFPSSRKRPRPAAPWLPEQTRKRVVMERRLALARDQPNKLQHFLLRRRELLELQTAAPAQHPVSDSVCAICLEDLHGSRTSSTIGELLDALPCGHVYHRRCIHQWSTYNRCCPIDRSTFE